MFGVGFRVWGCVYEGCVLGLGILGSLPFRVVNFYLGVSAKKGSPSGSPHSTDTRI